MSDNRQRGEEALSSLEKALNARERKKKQGPLMVAGITVLVLVLVVGGIVFAVTRDDETVTASEETSEAETSSEETTSAEESPDYEPLSMTRATALPATVTCEYTDNGRGDDNSVGLPDGEDVSTEGTVNVLFETNQGDIGLELDRAAAPCTVNSMVHLVEEGFYDDTVCHRLTSEETGGISILQCGDPTGTGSGGPGYSFADEYPVDEASEEELYMPVLYPRGSLAMANSGPDTNGSQFFLNYEDSPLAPNYTYFGQINDEGLETIDGIAEAGPVPSSDSPGMTAPAEEVRITSATVVN